MRLCFDGHEDTVVVPHSRIRSHGKQCAQAPGSKGKGGGAGDAGKCRSAKKKSNGAAAKPAAPLMEVVAGGSALSRCEGSTDRIRRRVTWAADLEQVQMIAGRFPMEATSKPAAKPAVKPDCPRSVIGHFLQAAERKAAARNRLAERAAKAREGDVRK